MGNKREATIWRLRIRPENRFEVHRPNRQYAIALNMVQEHGETVVSPAITVFPTAKLLVYGKSVLGAFSNIKYPSPVSSYISLNSSSQNWHRGCVPLFMDDINQIPSLTFYEYRWLCHRRVGKTRVGEGLDVSWCCFRAGQVWIDDSGSKNRGQVVRK